MSNELKFRGQVRKNGGLSILVVDDDDLNQRLLNLILARNNNVITFSYNGYEAIKIIDQNYFDLIFMDIQIPFIDGFEICEHVRSGKGSTDNQRTPIIALTALPSRDAKLQNYLDKGLFNECIQKPFSVPRIHEILKAVAEKKEIGEIFTNIETVEPDGENILNIEKVLPIFDYDVKAYQQLFSEFLLGLPERIKKARELEQDGDWKSLSIYAHNLTGIARNFGAERLAFLAELLDREAAQSNNSYALELIERIRESVPELEETFFLAIEKMSL